MTGMDPNIMARFKQIITEIPEDKRAVLYNRIKAMPEAERNQLICEFVSRYDASRKPVVAAPAAAPKSTSTPTRMANADSTPVPAPVRTDGKKHAKKRLKKSVKRAITLIIICLVLLGAIVLLLPNIDIFKSSSSEETSDATTVEETSVETTIEEPAAPTATSTPTPSPTPAPTMVPVREDAPDLSGLVVVIDPGHQEIANEEKEICSTALGNEKDKCTSGSTGVVTGIGEYDLTLQYALVAREYLEQCGATVILTREANDVDISNQERAAVANDNNADLFIRIHADAANDSATSGVRVYVPSSGSLVSENTSNANILGSLVASEEGFEFDSSYVRATNQYTGLNFSDARHSFQISLGFLSNSDDEAILINEDNMVNVASALAQFAYNYVTY